MSRAPITEDDLHAYVDGALDPGRRALVDRHLAEHPLEAARVAAWERQNATLGELYRHIGEEPMTPGARRPDPHPLPALMRIRPSPPRLSPSRPGTIAQGAGRGERRR